MYEIRHLKKIRKKISVPSDKSISHRAAILASLSSGTTSIYPYLISEDTIATLDCLKHCGVKIALGRNRKLIINGKGLYYPKKRQVKLYAKESGTTFRIFSGVLAGQKFPTYFDAHSSLKKRPMARITKPLRSMGADINGRKIKSNEYPPLKIRPVLNLKPINYKLAVASAQVKSAIIFASLYAKGITKISESFLTRDHTERMLKLFKARINRSSDVITFDPSKKLTTPKKIFIPSDFSSAAFFIILGLILKDSEIIIKNVSLNPTRCYLLAVLKRMGAKISVINKKNYFEPYADILVKSSMLKATYVKKSEVSLIIDEVPILCVAASFAKGTTTIKGVKELKVKETDRIKALLYNLKQAGVKAKVTKYKDQIGNNWQINIQGSATFKKAKFKSFSDHRTAMSAVVLGAAIEENSSLDNAKCINKSFPEFISLINSL